MSRANASAAIIVVLVGIATAGGCNAFDDPPKPGQATPGAGAIGATAGFFTGATGGVGGSFIGGGGKGGTGGVPCGPGLTSCGSLCVDTNRDNTSCGSCFQVCPASAMCTNGACVCPAGTVDCDGACIDTRSDPANCGACGVTCCPGSVCSNSVCVIGCAFGTVACGSGSVPTCDIACTDVSTNLLHCGACGNACVAGQTCELGLCQGGGGGTSGEGGTPGEGGATGSGAESGQGGSP